MSKCLTGEYEHRLDTKGRLIMPSKLREELGCTFMITKGLDNCLYVYPNDEWQQFADKLNQLPMTNESARQFKRFFNSGAVKCETDAQGRVIIPQTLRTFANIEKDVVIIGNGEKAEIWNKEAWDEINNEESLNMDEIADKLDELDFRI